MKRLYEQYKYLATQKSSIMFVAQSSNNCGSCKFHLILCLPMRSF